MQTNGAIFNPGDFLENRYRVVKLLGKGGFGQTFLVEDLEDGDSRKVLKVLFNQFPKAQELFQREAKVLQKLDCPGIPKVEREGYFTFRPKGVSKPLHCLVMEYIQGENLEEWLENHQPISQDLALDWLKQLIEILVVLHQQNYFHRDIKPANIMRKPDGRLALIDFGAVREVSETYLDKMSAKHPGTRINSAGYCAPEQADGQAVPESDFFSLGRTFVRLLAGQEPWKFKRDPNNGRLIWRGNAPQVSPELADLIDHLMAPFPGQRPDRAQIMFRLEAIETGLPIISPLVDRARRDRAFGLLSDRPVKGKLNLKIAAVVGLVSLGLVGGLRLVSPQIAVASNKQGVKHHRTEELVRAEAYYRLALLLKSDYAKVRYNLGWMYEKRNDRDRAKSEYLKAIQGGVSAAYNNLARLHILDRDCEKAVPLLLEGLNLAPINATKYPLLVNLGRAMFCQNRNLEARDYLQKAIAIDPDRSAAHCLLPPVLDGLGDKPGAILELEQCPSDAPNTLPELDNWLREQTLVARNR